MKLLLLTVLFSLGVVYLPAQQMKITDQGSIISFKIKNLGIQNSGTFEGLKGNVVFDEADLSNAVFDVTVEAASISTGIDLRDSHLREENYFDVKKYPQLSFRSASVSKNGKGKFRVAGKLTIKDVSKDISIPFTVTPSANGLTFQGHFNINRRDFHVGGGSMVLSDNVAITLSVVTAK